MSEEKNTERRVLLSYKKDMQKALEHHGATLGMQEHFRRSISHVATGFGVQPGDVKVIGEFEVKEGNKELKSTFLGFTDPHPSEGRKLISFKEAMRRDWEPA